jgi:hypothetical protein
MPLPWSASADRAQNPLLVFIVRLTSMIICEYCRAEHRAETVRPYEADHHPSRIPGRCSPFPSGEQSLTHPDPACAATT